MTLSRADAWQQLCRWTAGDSLRKHARAVEIVMRSAATHYGHDANIELWGNTGLLHDADYERWPTDHPKHIVAWLKARGEPEMAYAISAHYTGWGVSLRSDLDKALLACDELTGFIVACSLIRPEGVSTLTPKSVRKKLKSKSFAASVERSEVNAGFTALGVEPSRHIQFIIDALKPHHTELGI